MSVFDEIQTAAVIRYPYLWSREEGKGETGGRKVRPVAVGVRIARADGDLVLFFPITTKQPERDRFSFEIPVIEKRRAGLDADRQLWIIMDEYNSDLVGNSFGGASAAIRNRSLAQAPRSRFLQRSLQNGRNGFFGL